MELNVTERLELLRFVASGIPKPKTYDKITSIQTFIEQLMITEEEKVEIEWKEEQGPVKKAGCNMEKAKALLKDICIEPYIQELISMALRFSDLLDDMPISYYTLYQKFCLNRKA